jgi:enoyl-CoA hydratase
MDYQTLLYEKHDAIARVTVNRPEKRNALSRAVIEDLDACFAMIRDDNQVRAAILTGAGDKAFVAGADITELAVHTPVESWETSSRGQRTFELIENLGKPVIAAVNGYALGGGCELAMACTVRIASENATFAQPEVKLGIIPGFGGTQRLPRLVGKGIALELLLTGDSVTAAEACRIGLVNRVVPLGELLPTAEALALKMIVNAPLALNFCLEAVNRGGETSLAEGQFLESTLFGLCSSSADTKEGMQAFLEKRAPKFLGK